MRFVPGCAFVLSLLLAAPAVAADPVLDTDDKKTVYAIGVTIAQNLQGFNLTPEEVELVLFGFKDGFKGAPKVDLAEFGAKVKQFAQTRALAAADVEKKESQGFLDKMAKEKDAKRSDSGMIFIPLKAGSGDSPKATDTVKVHYEGKLRDGSTFDSSVQRGAPATFPLNRVIPCWTEGLQKMKVGEKAKLVCPSNIAYGDRGSPPKIKPGAALLFEVELLGIEAPAPASTSPGHGGMPQGH
jgi:FKBP-type peptidyl-prolyl cis-trans isomerase FkpA/FKBP-type peptidyl-prolyl cis-trans isomerase FklB